MLVQDQGCWRYHLLFHIMRLTVWCTSTWQKIQNLNVNTLKNHTHWHQKGLSHQSLRQSRPTIPVWPDIRQQVLWDIFPKIGVLSSIRWLIGRMCLNWFMSEQMFIGYWYCGGRVLYNVPPSGWTGTCTILSLIAPIKVIKTSALDLQKTADNLNQKRSIRHKRDFDIYRDSPTYIDSIGVPRGVLNEYKLVDENCSRIWINTFLVGYNQQKRR